MPYPLVHCQARHTLRATLIGTTAVALAATLGLGTAPAFAAGLGPLTKVSDGDLFAKCKADNVAKQEKSSGQRVWPNSEVETFVAADPSDPSRLIAAFQQDRWTDGAARGLAAGVSRNGGTSWKDTIPPGNSKCSGGPFDRSTDPWVSIGPTGVAYFMSLVLDADPKGTFTASGMQVNRSTDGGLTWGKPVSLILDTDPQLLDDKNSITADPTDPKLAYAVWDRLQGAFAEEERHGEGGGGGDVGHLPANATKGLEHDGVALAQARMRRALAGLAVTAPAPAGTLPPKGPALFSRTTDGGRSWEKAEVIYDPGYDAQTLGNQIVVRPDGTVIDFFSNLVFAQLAPRIGLVRSHDKGKTFEKKPSFVASVAMTKYGTVTPDAPFFFVRDAAALFDVAVDPTNGNLYVVWQDARFAGIGAIAFSVSTDGGDTWSTPVQVNQTPPLKVKTRRQAFIPSVEVGPGGVVVVTYYDFRNDNASGELTDYWAVLCNPGKADCRKAASWGGELRLTPKPFDILNAPVTTDMLFLGDYMGLTRAGDAVVPTFGIADGPQQSSIYARRITFGGKAAAVAALGQ